MLWKIALYINIIALRAILCVSFEEIVPSGNVCLNLESGIFQFVNVTSFVDENRYIRLNISWGEPTVNFTNFEIEIETTNCNALYGERYLLVDQKFVIVPNMERLKHPAEPLLHGCKYEFQFKTEEGFGNPNCLKQVVDYEIPECVNTVCECGVADSPYKYQGIKHLRDHIYEIKFNKTNSNMDINLEAVFHTVSYSNMDFNKTMTMVHPSDIIFENNVNSLKVPFNDFHGGNSYRIYIGLVLDNCEYNFIEEIHVPQEVISESGKHYVIYSVTLLFLCISLFLCAFLRTKPLLVEKLRTYLPFLPAVPILPTHSQELCTFKVTKEVINSQYTPLEFIVNSHNFDKYEFPRNKIILKNEIGVGAFGHVFKADIYELDNKPGYTEAAAKKPIENAPSEELADFLAEIETMKKIADSGGHINVIKILACVTIESPPILVMELVPYGSLKSYLSSLRKEWEQRKLRLRIERNNQRFFPDNMIVEHYLHPETNKQEKAEEETLKYSDLAFNDYTGASVSSGTNSYVTPDTPRTPSTPGSPFGFPNRPKINNDLSKTFKLRRPRLAPKTTTSYLLPHSPLTPDSISSSGLPSVTETLLTPLESEAPTPLINLTEEDKPKPVLDSKELQNFALQIANGMAFLESIEITHRDLAARNILIGEGKVLKISDFGMAREGIYVNTAQKRQPLRWMAPEAIENRRCDNKTDVWSFGVVLWEIGSLGAFPYKDLSNELVIAHIMQGKILERPETCTDQVYELMQKCWQKNPDDRPRFEEIAKQLDLSNGKIYVDFSKISPKYTFPPIQEATGSN